MRTLTGKGTKPFGFLSGYYKAILWGFQAPDPALGVFSQKLPAVDCSTALNVLDLTFFHSSKNFTEAKGIGYMDYAKTVKTMQVTFEASAIKGNLAPTEIFTNEFVDGIPAALLLLFKRKQQNAQWIQRRAE